VAGLKAGESKSFDLRFPDDYHGKEVAGKTARFEVTVKQVGEPHLPEVDAEFAKTLGVADGDLAKMRAEIRANLEREVKGKLKARVKDQVMQALLDATKLEAPRALVEMETERMAASARQDLAARGIRVPEGAPMPMDMFEEQAKRRVSLGLILGEVVKAHNLFPTPDQVKALVEEQAQSYERPAEVVKWFYAAPERLREIESVVMEENVMTWALATTRVTDKPVEFEELMGKR
jgi:trigger factor